MPKDEEPVYGPATHSSSGATASQHIRKQIHRDAQGITISRDIRQIIQLDDQAFRAFLMQDQSKAEDMDESYKQLFKLQQELAAAQTQLCKAERDKLLMVQGLANSVLLPAGLWP